MYILQYVHLQICIVLSVMVERNPQLKVNPGGALEPIQVVGRDEFIASLWHSLESRSVLLTSERRMGKTSVMRKMEAEALPGVCPVRTSLQGINAPEEFARRLIADIEQAAPGALDKPFLKRVRKSGLKKVGTKVVEVEFEPVGDEAWKDVLTEAFAALDDRVDEQLVFFWDELPHMIAAIEMHRDATTARDVLDMLRHARESYPSLRMVLTGSLGMHHVVDRLREQGVMFAPVHDMAIIDLPPLSEVAATYLASELLRNEKIECDDADSVAAAIATEVDSVPYYVHHTVDQLRDGPHSSVRPVDDAGVRRVVEAAVIDPLDPWQLKHYLDRMPVYYGSASDLACAVLDIVATETKPLSLDEIERLLAAQMPPPKADKLRDLVELLCKDYYLEPGYGFRLELVRRAWRARRPAR